MRSRRYGHAILRTLAIRVCLCGLVLVVIIATTTPGTVYAKIPERGSLALETPSHAWLSPGFRLGIGFGYNSMLGVRHSPSWYAYEVWIEPQYRIDRQWSLGLGLSYAFPQRDVTGISWRVMADTTYQPWRGLLLQWGVGLAGLAIQRNDVITTVLPTSETDATAVPATYTTTDDGVILEQCDGTGAAARVRLGYTIVVGGLFATGPTMQLYGQWIRCGQEITGSIDTDPITGSSLEIRQWWKQWGWSAGWLLTWR